MNSDTTFHDHLFHIFQRMAVSKQPATNRGAILKYGTFQERTRHFLNIRTGYFSASSRVNHSIAYTLVAYANNLGIKLDLNEVDAVIHQIVERWLESRKTTTLTIGDVSYQNHAWWNYQNPTKNT